MNIANKIINSLFLAFSTGKDSDATNSPKRYIGIGNANIIAVNPNREKFNEIFPHSKNTDPISYTGIRELDGKQIQTARVCFIVKLDPKFNEGIDATFPIYFNLEKRFRLNKDSSKIQVIDEFGRTAWLTKQELDTNAIPVYANGPAPLSTNYHPVIRGEESLIRFLRAFLCIDDIDVWNDTTKTFEKNSNPDACRSLLEKINDYFNGDFSEIIEAINLRPDNKVKILFGVRHSDDNKDYQDFFNGWFLKNRQRSIAKMQQELDNAKNNGSYPNTDFIVDTIKEYTGPEPTKFEKESSIFEDPFADNTNALEDLPFGY